MRSVTGGLVGAVLLSPAFRSLSPRPVSNTCRSCSPRVVCPVWACRSCSPRPLSWPKWLSQTCKHANLCSARVVLTPAPLPGFNKRWDLNQWGDRFVPQSWFQSGGLPTNNPPHHSQCARRWGMGMFGIGIGLSINDGISISVVTDLFPIRGFKVVGSVPINVFGGWFQYGGWPLCE